MWPLHLASSGHFELVFIGRVDYFMLKHQNIILKGFIY